jgi:hypothetical protein
VPPPIHFEMSHPREADWSLASEAAWFVTPHVIKQDLPPLLPDPADLGFLAGRQASVHEILFFQLLEIFRTPPSCQNAKIHVDFSKKVQQAEPLGRWMDI